MRRKKANPYIIIILFTQILVYFFKVDNDVFALQEYIHHPHQTYTEQPYTKYSTNFKKYHDRYSQCIAFSNIESGSQESVPWRIKLRVYNSVVHHFLKYYKTIEDNIPRIALIFRKQSITNNMSSDDEGPSNRCYVNVLV